MCFPMWSPIVRKSGHICHVNTLISHSLVAESCHIDKFMFAASVVNKYVWLPEWNWVKRWATDNWGFPVQAFAWQESQEFQSINSPDWVKQSTLKELDRLIEKHFPTWQKLYEAFRRTDNLLPRNKDLPVGEVKPRSILLDNATRICTVKNKIDDEIFYVDSSLDDVFIDKFWDMVYSAGKNPDNLIPVWRD